MSLLIEALKQAEARKGPKGGKPGEGKDEAKDEAKDKDNDQAAAQSTPETGADAAGAPAAEASSGNSEGGLQLSLAPQEERPPREPTREAPSEDSDEGKPASQAQEQDPPADSAPAASQPAPAPRSAGPGPAEADVPAPTPGPSEPAAPVPPPVTKAPPSAPAPGPAPRTPTPAEAARIEPPSRPGPGTDARRKAAREVMAAAAQQRPATPRRGWRVLLGALVVVALLLAGGMWWLTQQNQSQFATTPTGVQPVSDAVLAEAEQGFDAGAGDALPTADPTVTAAPPSETTGLVAGSDGSSPGTLNPPQPNTDAVAPAAGPAAFAGGGGETAPGMPAAATPVLIASPAQRVDPAPTLRIERARQAQQPLLSGYAALNRGELPAARRDYQRALQLHPGHPDALLGLAVIAEREGDYEGATRRYREVLKVDPRNPTALAALIGSAPPAAGRRSESELREALAAQPRSPALHFALGNLLAAANRWDEAQQAYFDAAVLAPDDPDVVFNLGVALDRLHKPRLALDHYLRAEELRRARPANYDPYALAARITTLSQQLARSGDGTR
ncbi:tetratricopeptide repeat protein [Pseudomarimonas salicorniae]|uniref:Tetratricopeptide repeat protein n=1 Tax=Pseudomarimonas salicorniae TaxID=2933270 RepID=A0ABT0GE57_9GAMM|nr:tetratricopeptide repeat protein [Lysobacter sp. CAU 1642]MCK7592839.1 tetratricopeptide repeat protein [Lysobacter sp. CAU 1642]